MPTVLERLIEDRLIIRDHCSATVVRGNVAVGFTESLRDGRAAHANVEGGVVFHGITGDPPQNETGTLETARTLVAVLNSRGARWGAPQRVEIPYIDVQATDTAGRMLNLQVTRACINKKFWEQAAQNGRSISQRPIVEVADELRASIRKKESIPQGMRADIVLVLSALDSPGHAMPEVVGVFAERHGREVESLGFAEVWLTGPHPALCHQLALRAETRGCVSWRLK